MQTKLRAARLAARSGAATVIAYGREQNVLQRLRAGEEIGTLLTSAQRPEAARKRWIAGQLQARGRLVLDAGDGTNQMLDMLLAKKRAGDRKSWLEEKGDLAEIVA